MFLENLFENLSNIWVGFASLSPYYEHHGSIDDVPEKLRINPTDFLSWFELQLVELCYLDLSRIQIELKVLNGKIKELKLVSVSFR